MSLPVLGGVLGVDIGYSTTNRSSAVCRLDWSGETVTLTVDRFRAVEPERTEALHALCDRELLAAAFDGPLSAELGTIGVYRMAEQVLTRGFQAIGKPGQSSSPNGKKLNAGANECVRIVLAAGRVGPASHRVAIHELAIAEAFPTTFLGVMLDRPGAAVGGRHRSDRYYEYLAQTGRLDELLAHLLPCRALRRPFADCRNHDDRAAIICALTALCVAAGDYTAVGDQNGWIVLPPAKFVEPWCWPILERNVAEDASVLFRSAR